MAQQQPPPDAPDLQDSIVIKNFEGLCNVVAPERLKPEEFRIGRNIDIDDRGEARRRRGYTKKLIGDCHSIFTSTGGRVYCVFNGTLGRVNPDYSFVPLVEGITPDPLAYVQVGKMLYFSSARNSGKIDMQTLTPFAWGAEDGHSYWFSPVVHPETPPLAGPGAPNPNVPLVEGVTLPPINGRLFGDPPMATSLTWFNGRIYLAQRRTLWATELFLYDYVDKTKNFRQFEEDITGLGMVEDGVYVGTAGKVYFLSGAFAEHQRTIVHESPVTPGSMIQVMGSAVEIENRLRPDIPTQAQHCVLALTSTGVIACFQGGKVLTFTRSDFWFPAGERAAPLFRTQDGMNTAIMAINSEGTPRDGARFSDRLDCRLIRAKDLTG